MPNEWEVLRYGILALQREGQRLLSNLLQPLALTPSQAEVLRVAEEYGPLHLRRLGNLLICESGSPSRLVVSLVRRGLIAKAADPEDVRRTLIELTPDGKDMVARVAAAEKVFYQGLANRLGEVPSAFFPVLDSFLSDTTAGRALALRGLWPPTSEGRDCPKPC